MKSSIKIMLMFLAIEIIWFIFWLIVLQDTPSGGTPPSKEVVKFILHTGLQVMSIIGISYSIIKENQQLKGLFISQWIFLFFSSIDFSFSGPYYVESIVGTVLVITLALMITTSKQTSGKTKIKWFLSVLLIPNILKMITFVIVIEAHLNLITVVLIWYISALVIYFYFKEKYKLEPKT